MTKKIFAMFLAVLMVVSMLPTSVFAANECPGKNNPKHSTSNCDYTVVKVTDPTCGTDGHTSYKCNKCGYTFAEKTADATGEHSFVAGEGKAPTCIEDGYEAGLECEVCGLVKPGKEIPKLDKDAVDCEWEIISGYDCDNEKGKIVEQCAFCGDIRETTREEYEEMLKEWDPDFVPLEEHVIDWSEYVPITDTQVAFLCYGAGITGCSHYVVADIKNAHDCADYIYRVERVEPTCTTDGMVEHDQCRICNTKYGWVESLEKYTYLTAKNIEEEYVIKAAHSFVKNGEDYEATCADTLLFCKVCEKYVNPGIEHEVDWEEPDGEVQDATCLKPGYMYDTCANCQVKELKILDATGHNEITVTMPSTCGTYAYTFTYCTHANCDAPALEKLEVSYDDETGLATVVYDENGMSYPVMVPALAVTDDLADLADGFLMAMVQENLEKTLYFNGKIANGNHYQLGATANPDKAVTVYFEQLENYRSSFLLYFFNEDGEKTYIHIYKANDGYINLGLTTEEPETFFSWNDEYGIFTTEIDGKVYFMGSYGDRAFFSKSEIKYLEQENPNFAMKPYAMVGETGVHLTGFTFDEKGGYNAEKHVYDVEFGSIKLPTCTKAGSYDKVCGYCFDTVTVEIPAGCVNNLLYADKFDMESTVRPATAEECVASGIKLEKDEDDQPILSGAANCTEGAWIYVFCEGCEEAFKLTLTAPLGHDMTIWHDDTAALCHTKLNGYKGYDCAYCDYAIKLETISWKNVNKLYDTVAKAEEDHGEGNLEFVQLSKNGSCTVAGIELYACSECGKNVRVRQWQDIVVGKDDEGNKIYQSFPTGEHAGHRLTTVVEIEGEEVELINHKDPTCTAAGWHITYQCARCDAIIGNKALGEMETLKKLAHTFVEVNMLPEATIAAINAAYEKAGLDIELKEYEAAPCDKPNYDNIKYVCVVCLTTKGDGTDEHVHDDLDRDECKDTTIEVYTCHCGEIHIRAMGSYDHKWFVVEQTKENKGTIWAPATCYQYGWYTVKCEYCGDTDIKLSATVEHENAAGEKFTDSCLDEVTDRHCVVCCEFFKHDAKGNKHDCTKTDKDEDGNTYFICETVYHECSYHHVECDETCETECKLICADDCKKHCNGCLLFIEDGCQVPSFCHYKYEENRPSTCVQDAHTLYICGDCGDEIVVGAEVNEDIEPAGTQIAKDFVWFYGHKPVSNITLANYTYLDVLYQEVVVEDDEFVWTYELIENAEFVEYKAPTFNVEGYAKFYCEHCDAVVEQVLPKLGGMAFELDIKNANGQDGFTYGSLIEVTVSINGNDVDVNNFTFDAFSGFEFVGFETLNNELFHLTVTDPASDNEIVIEPTDILDDVLSYDKVTVTGVAANTAAGKMQNVNINEKTELVKLFFRIDDEFFAMFGMEDFEFMYFVDGEVNKWISGKTTETIYEGFIGQDGVIDVECLADFDGNGYATVNDLSLALTLLTGEHPTGATYDVTVDMNKDGVITLEDLSIAHNLFVDNLTLEEVFYMGMSEAEIELFEGQKDHFCVNCGYEGVTEDMKYCPECGRNPHAK